MKLMPGDTVLVRIKAFRVNQKITDKWEQKPYVLVGTKTICCIGTDTGSTSI